MTFDPGATSVHNGTQLETVLILTYKTLDRCLRFLLSIQKEQTASCFGRVCLVFVVEGFKVALKCSVYRIVLHRQDPCEGVCLCKTSHRMKLQHTTCHNLACSTGIGAAILHDYRVIPFFYVLH